MPRVQLTVEVSGIGGLEPTQTNLNTDGHSFLASKDVQVRINNGATAFTLTIPTSRTVDGFAVADQTISVGANETHIINFRDVNIDNFVQSGGVVHLNYSDTTDGTVEVWR